MGIATVTTHLFRPGQVRVDQIDREIATRVVDQAYARGLIDQERAGLARAAVADARTRDELDAGVGDLPGAVRPASGLTTLVRVLAALCLVSTAVQVVVWASIGLVGGWDTPWWLWSAAVGAVIVTALWWVAETPRRTARVLHAAHH
ncbi:DUF1707 domain-containing protein [Actinocatenispora rupis]|uniref:DUF1707 domain-containing protein n=1 Tax=Actinocatenispora rupis TaxID=519421 RepID=A0A8J3J4Z6_9ACTN|nr:DUF1707 domain-containing protein [Actinocatenispora rupis]GID11716.1 hypothetical protein Aru02nite_26050 [Actinocatenispora rupis]